MYDNRLRFCLLLSLLVGAAGFLLGLNGCGAGLSGVAVGSPVDPPPIQHVVVIFQENRSTDNLFHDFALITRGADIASTGIDSIGQTVPLGEVDLATSYDLDHSHTAFVAMYDGGKMDGADRIEVICPDPGPFCAPQNAQFMYVNPAEVLPYFQLAEQYTFGDRMFQTNQGPSFPAHQFIIAGTSAPTATSTLFAAENPGFAKGYSGPPAFFYTGCTAPVGEAVNLIDHLGRELSSQYPCFEHPTLSDLLDAKNISWRYYTPSAGVIWTGPNAIQHMCQAQNLKGQLLCTGKAWNNVIIPQSRIFDDISSNQLAAVSWVIPDGRASDHANMNDGSGPSWVASVVNAIGNSSYWANTAIIITWDDWGGWYDHVTPKILNSYEYGFRVPLIVVSPYARPGYISHVTHDFGSILRFIENKFQLPSLGYADAVADDLSDCFDFTQTPIRFQSISAPLDADHFLNDHRAPAAPDDD